MQAFKVTFNLKSPAVVNNDVYLDSLISSAKCREILKDKFFSNSKQAGDIELIRSTLDCLIEREFDVYKCSKLFFTDESCATTNYVKRFEHKFDFYVDANKKVDEQRGFFKSAYNALYYSLDYSPYAFCEGDLGEIKRLLTDNIQFIGKKASQGYGQIKSIEFEEIDKFNWIHNNALVRNIPAKYASQFKGLCDFDIAEIPLISPYWREERELCIY